METTVKKHADAMEDRMMNPTETAAMIGWQPTSLMVMKARNILPFPYYKVGKMLRFRKSEIEAYLASVRVPSARNPDAA